jgi:glycosyltransferase involved in cell wall biosynthesis
VEAELGISISVVIPTLDEQEHLRRALTCTRLRGVERIVVDGGSRDGSAHTARFLRAEKVLFGPPALDRRMDVGYRVAAGEVVLFLRADTRLEPGWRDAIARALLDPRVQGGAFRLGLEASGLRFRALEGLSRLRCALFGLARADQAIFLRRKLLDQIHGVPETPVFADLDLARAIRDHGRMARLSMCAFTPVERCEATGTLRALAREALVWLGYLLDVDRERVARGYRRKRP